MKGQRLFIRPIEASDASSLREFLDRHGVSSPVPACGLLGKLIGDLVGMVAMRITPEALEIENVLVSKDLRRKHIGRALIAEAEQIAVRLERAQLVVTAPAGGEFLRRVGFDREGERWIRQVRVARTEPS